ncbi:flagellar biosynthesis regulator FlaF [Bradyrhizobium sp. Arg68]|uniref:flagellar biosynthesis regulator FlaF n=1 Tax=Bradyrhizobium ivorense TaxID=2511166 RepID=UPI001E533869|nr:flagellar biosynthesis regulator FlaF [Bradyrhizobium ivorense]MCC8938236.1 flagellar biosynthesis regulator FlaF [Bradyrhizobium ivorense]
MTFEAYETIAEDSSLEARSRERQALTIGIDRLERLQDGVFSNADLVESLLYIRKLWTLLIEDLAHPDNGLPDKLRADIISIGLWVIREADRLRETRSNDVVRLVEINRLIRDALQ